MGKNCNSFSENMFIGLILCFKSILGTKNTLKPCFRPFFLENRFFLVFLRKIPLFSYRKNDPQKIKKCLQSPNFNFFSKSFKIWKCELKLFKIRLLGHFYHFQFFLFSRFSEKITKILAKNGQKQKILKSGSGLWNQFK